MVEIHDYDYKPEPKFFGTPQNFLVGNTVQHGVYYGVELELDVAGFDRTDPKTKIKSVTPAAEAAQDLLGDFCYIKWDGSVLGIEIVTHPATLKVHRNRWRQFFNDLPKNKDGLPLFQVTTRDGLHHHFSREPLTKHQVWLVHNFVNSQAKVKPVRKPEPGDCTCDYCRSMQETGRAAALPWLVKLAGRDFNQYSAWIVKPETQLDNHELHGKHEAVNTKPQSTVEVRLYAATLDYTTFMLRLEFTAAMVQAVQHGVDPLTVESLKSFLCSHPKRFPVLVPWMAKEAEL